MWYLKALCLFSGTVHLTEKIGFSGASPLTRRPRRELGMPDYIHLLESKLSPNQKQALNAITDLARERGMTVFLTGGAVRDIVSGASVRDLDISVQGNPMKLKKELTKAGFSIAGEHEPSRTIYLRFGNRARVEVSNIRTEHFPKPARPEYKPAGILEDLRRRDFTANAMALSLNEGSWGLLLDPLNGMADISNRQLRLVSNYGFLEDPIRMVRAIRLLARTGWEMDERTKARYENAKEEGVFSAVTAAHRGYELEEIAYEEDPLQTLKALEREGWMEHLFPAWSSHSVDTAGLERLHERLVQLLMGGLHPDPSAAQLHLLTAKLSSAHLSALKRLFVRSDLLHEKEVLDKEAKKFADQIMSKEAAKPSQLWRIFQHANPEAVLWLYFTAKTAAIQNRFDSFFTKWAEARQKIPNAILQDMRILPDVPGYAELLDKLTFAFMDDEIGSEEAIRKFAEPYSPPAPPPPVVVRRSRAVKRVVEPKKSAKALKKAAAEKAAAEAAAALAAAGGEVPAAAVEPLAKPAGKAAKATAKTVPQAAKAAAAGKVSQIAAHAGKAPVAEKLPAAKAGGKSAANSAAVPAAHAVKKAAKPAAKASSAAVKKVSAKSGDKKETGKRKADAKKSSVKTAAAARGTDHKTAKTAKPAAKVAPKAAAKATVKAARPSPVKAKSGKTTAKKSGSPSSKKAEKSVSKAAVKQVAKSKSHTAAKAVTKHKPATKKKAGK